MVLFLLAKLQIDKFKSRKWDIPEIDLSFMKKYTVFQVSFQIRKPECPAVTASDMNVKFAFFISWYVILP